MVPSPQVAVSATYGANVNIMESKFLDLIKQHSVSPKAADWLLKALHPPSGITKVALPDASWRPGLRVDARPSTVVTFADDVNWDCLIVTPPGDNTFAVIATAPSPADFTTAAAPADGSIVVIQVAKPEDFTTITHNATETVLSSTPSTVIQAKQVDTAQSAYDAQAFRTTYRSITVSLTASDLYNGGTLTVGQYDAAYVDTGLLVNVAGPGANDAMAAQVLTNLPLSENFMTQGMPSVRTSPAKEGYYMPHRLLGPTQPFLSSATAVGKHSYAVTLGAPNVTSTVVLYDPATTPNTSTQLSVPRIFEVAAGETTIPWWSSLYAVSGISGAPLFDIGYDNCATGIAIFRNLDSHASLTVQGYVGYEYVLRQNSPFLNFVEASAAYDSRAIKLYYDVVNSMAMVYPADHNDLGKLLGKLYSVARGVVATISPIVAPVLSAAAKAAAEKAVESAMSPAALIVTKHRRSPHSPVIVPRAAGHKAPRGPQKRTQVARRKRS